MKPEDFNKELVWNDDESKAIVRTVVVEYSYGSCLALHENDRIAFQDNLTHDNVTLTRWKHHKPIPEKKMRPMTTEECIIWAVTEGYKDWVVKGSENENPYAPALFDYDEPEYLFRAKITEGKIGEWQKFEVEE